MSILNKAKAWWNSLTPIGKSNFPHLSPSDEEIIEWYSDPAGYTLPPNITY
jgi:hypothetical protein